MSGVSASSDMSDSEDDEAMVKASNCHRCYRVAFLIQGFNRRTLTVTVLLLLQVSGPSC